MTLTATKQQMVLAAFFLSVPTLSLFLKIFFPANDHLRSIIFLIFFYFFAVLVKENRVLKVDFCYAFIPALLSLFFLFPAAFHSLSYIPIGAVLFIVPLVALPGIRIFLEKMNPAQIKDSFIAISLFGILLSLATIFAAMVGVEYLPDYMRVSYDSIEKRKNIESIKGIARPGLFFNTAQQLARTLLVFLILGAIAWLIDVPKKKGSKVFFLYLLCGIIHLTALSLLGRRAVLVIALAVVLFTVGLSLKSFPISKSKRFFFSGLTFSLFFSALLINYQYWVIFFRELPDRLIVAWQYVKLATELDLDGTYTGSSSAIGGYLNFTDQGLVPIEIGLAALVRDHHAFGASVWIVAMLVFLLWCIIRLRDIRGHFPKVSLLCLFTYFLLVIFYLFKTKAVRDGFGSISLLFLFLPPFITYSLRRML